MPFDVVLNIPQRHHFIRLLTLNSHRISRLNCKGQSDVVVVVVVVGVDENYALLVEINSWIDRSIDRSICDGSESDEYEYEAICKFSSSYVSGNSGPRNDAYQCEFGVDPSPGNGVELKNDLLRGNRRASLEVHGRNGCAWPIQEQFISPYKLAF